MIDPADIAADFHKRFGRTPRLYRAPGRVNLIGEHTDYNDGFVMPVALDRSTWVAAARRDDRAIVVHSREYDETVTIPPADHGGSTGGPQGGPSRHWADYLRGVASVLGLFGADLLIASDVPIGAGLGSSAALEVAVGYALLDLANGPADADGRASVDLTALALACQRAEHEYAGTRCGVMDQMIACHGRTGHAVTMDTRTLQCRWLPLPARVRIIVCNTMVTHELASGEYNARRADCEAGVRVLARHFPGIRALRDASLEQLEAVANAVPDRIVRRCRHVIGEDTRVEAAARAIVEGDLASFGRLMGESHISLRDDYEVSCAELDVMVAIASGMAGVYGARMTGGGFGGCAVVLVDVSTAEAAAREIGRCYENEMKIRPDIWICDAGPGVSSATLNS
jgi:galactokinase